MAPLSHHAAPALVLAMSLAAGVPAACKQTHTVLEPSTDAIPSGDAGASDTSQAPPAVSAFSISYYHACAIASGALYCWGANDDGRLGVGDTADRRAPVRVNGDTDWLNVAVGERSTLALKRDGTLWSFGGNDNGELGLGDFQARQTPTRIGDRADWRSISIHFTHACALPADGSLWCWGANSEGQLGQDETNTASTDRPVPTQVTTARDFASVDAGQGHTCAIRRDGTLWCWGRNSEAELGQGSSTPLQIHHPVKVGTATDWQIMSSGQNSSCGVRGGQAHCWGRVIDQSLPGSAGATVVSVPTLIGAPAGTTGLSFNTFGGCLLDAQGAAACWGRNAEGQLGLGDMDVRTAVEPVPSNGWTLISAGRFSNCGIRDDRAWCTGDNRHGQIGQGDVDRTSVFVEVVLTP